MAVGQAYFVNGGTATIVAAGTTGATGTAVLAAITTVTGADATKGVTLPYAFGADATAGPSPIRIVNSDAAVLKVYPPTGGTIDGAAVDAALSVAASSSAVFTPTAGLTYISTAGTLTAAQSGLITGITAGTVTASKAVVVDASKNIATFGTIGSAAITVTAVDAASLAVGRLGATTPCFQVDASTATQVAGLKVTGAASGSGVAVASIGGTNELITIDSKGSGTIGIGTVNTGGGLLTVSNATALGGITINGPSTVTSASATALAVGRLGATTPGLLVDASTATSITGLKIKTAATGNGVALSAIGAAAEPMTIDAATTGAITIGGTSTGQISLGRGVRSAAIVNNTKLSVTAQNTTPTAAQLLGGYYAHTSQTGAGTATLPLASLLSTAVTGVAVGDSFCCLYNNIGNQTVTVTTNTGWTVSGTAAIPTLRNAMLYFYNTGSNTWDCVVVLGG